MDIDKPLKKEEKTPILDAQKGKIKLNPENPSHKDWYEDK